MLRKMTMALVACCVLLTTAACGAKNDQGAQTAPTPAAGPTEQAPKSLKHVSLVLDWYPNAVHAFLLAAQEQGYFKDEGLDVEMKMPASDPTDGVKLVGAGKDTFAIYYQPDTLQARDQGIPVVSVAAIVRRSLNVLMVPTASGVKTPKDLEGKSLGSSGSALQGSVSTTMIKTAGGDPAKVKQVDVGWDLIPAIATKKVDAITGGYINHEKLLLEKEGIPMTAFAPADYGVPNYYELVLLTGEETAKKDPEMIKAFWRAATKGQAWVKAHQADALKLLLAKQSKDFPLDQDVESKSLAMLLPWMEESGVPFGVQKKEDWEKFTAWMTQTGGVKNVKAADAFVDILR